MGDQGTSYNRSAFHFPLNSISLVSARPLSKCVSATPRADHYCPALYHPKIILIGVVMRRQPIERACFTNIPTFSNLVSGVTTRNCSFHPDGTGHLRVHPSIEQGSGSWWRLAQLNSRTCQIQPPSFAILRPQPHRRLQRLYCLTVHGGR